MFRTRITEMLEIEYPIICGGMMWISDAKLVAAVSEAGGMGILASMMFPTKETLKEEIHKVKELTDKPFGVNINLFPALRPADNPELIDVCIEEEVKAIETSGRSPKEYVDQIRGGGVKLIHKCARVKDVISVSNLGVDAVAIVGFECGGAPPMDDITTLIQVPLAVDAVKGNMPVLAGGGIGDARGFVAALSLGAEGVVMGTRFLATHECLAHPNIKEALIKAKETDTIPLLRSIKSMERVFKNETAEKVAELERKGAGIEELIPLIAGENVLEAFNTGNVKTGIISCGEVVGLIDGVVSVKEVIEEIIDGAKDIVERLYPLIEV